MQHMLFASVVASLSWPDLMWLGWIFLRIDPILSSKLINLWEKIEFRHLIQHMLFILVFISQWWADLVQLEWIPHRSDPLESSTLMKMWWKMEFWHFIQHALFKSVFDSPRWLDFIWVGPALQGRNWRHRVMQANEDVTENEDMACIGHVVFVSVFTSPCGPHLIALGLIF